MTLHPKTYTKDRLFVLVFIQSHTDTNIKFLRRIYSKIYVLYLGKYPNPN